MSDKEQPNPQYQPQPKMSGYYPIYPVPKEEEIDLFDLIAQLWKKKWWIIGCMFLTTFIAAVYAFTAKEQWTATAVVGVPSYNTISNYYEGVQILSEEPEKIQNNIDVIAAKLFNKFIDQLSSYNEINNFIRQTDYFKKLTLGKNEKETDKILGLIVNSVSIKKDKNSNTYLIGFSANTSRQAKQLLNEYISYVNNNVSTIQYNEISFQMTNKMSSIKSDMDALVDIAKLKHKNEIKRIQLSIAIAEKANIEKPIIQSLTNINENNLFLFGKEALNAMLENISKQPLPLNELYYNLQRKYIGLDNFNINKNNSQLFLFLKNPIEPIKIDKPNRLIIVILGIIIGFIIGVFISLFDNHMRNKLSN